MKEAGGFVNALAGDSSDDPVVVLSPNFLDMTQGTVILGRPAETVHRITDTEATGTSRRVIAMYNVHLTYLLGGLQVVID